MKIQQIPIDKIIPYVQNPKAHPEGQVKKLAGAIAEFKWDQPIVVDKDMVIIKGHGRLLAAQALGVKTVPVVVADYLTPAQVKAARLADNRVAESEWFPATLALELKALEEMDFDLSLTGFDLDELEGFGIGQGGDPPPEDPGPQIDRAAELQEKWGTALGQTWQVGRHRVMCGDARVDFEKLTGGQKIDMVFTDPPYGANIVKEIGASVGGAKAFGSKGWIGGGAAYKIPVGGRGGAKQDRASGEKRYPRGCL